MAFTKSTATINNISSQPDKPVISATALKALFDKYSSDDNTYINSLIDELEAVTSAANLGAVKASDGTSTTVQAEMNRINSAIVSAVLGVIPDNSITDSKIALTSKIVFSNLIPTFTGGVGGAEGGKITLAKPLTTNITNDVVLDIQADYFRMYESGGGYRGFRIPMTKGSVADNLINLVQSGTSTIKTYLGVSSGEWHTPSGNADYPYYAYCTVVGATVTTSDKVNISGATLSDFVLGASCGIADYTETGAGANTVTVYSQSLPTSNINILCEVVKG